MMSISGTAMLVAAHPFIVTPASAPAGPSTDPETGLMAVVDANARKIRELEPQFRTMLRLSLDPEVDPQPRRSPTGRRPRRAGGPAGTEPRAAGPG